MRAVLAFTRGAFRLGALVSLLCIAALADGQTIRMPDFRRPMTYQVMPGEPCDACGRISSIREKPIDRRAAVPPALSTANVGASSGLVQPNLVGAVVYLPLGESGERPFVGGVGTPEMRERFRETTYEIVVRLDDGATRFIERTDATRFQVGDRVRIAGVDELELVVQ